MRVTAIAFFLTALLLTGNALGQITSAQSGEWRLGTTWVGGVVPTMTDDVIIAADHTVSVDDQTSECHSLSFGSETASIDMNANGWLSIYGDFTLASTSHCVFAGGWSATNARVIFAGSEDQTISGFSTSTGSTAFRDLVVNKPSGTVSTAGGSQIIGIQQTFEIVSGTFILGAGDDIEERIATSGSRYATPRHAMAITVQADGVLEFTDGTGDHWVRSGLGSHPIGPVTVYGQMEVIDASSSDISFSGITIKDGGEFTLGTGLGSTTYGPELNCGTITVEDGGTLVNTSTSDMWFVSDGLPEHPDAAVDLQDGGTFEITASSAIFPSVFTDNGRVRYARTSTSTDQTIIDRGYNRVEFSFPSDGSRNKNWNLTGDRQVADSLTINNRANLVLTASSAQTLTVNNTIRLTSGTLDNSDPEVTLVVADGATISRATGSMLAAPQFAGSVNLRYTSSVEAVTTGPEMPTSSGALYDLTSIASAGLLLGSNVQVNGTLLLDGGGLNTNGFEITLGPAATINEIAPDRVQGHVDVTRSVALATEEQFGGIGISVIAQGAAPGSTRVLRVTGSPRNLGGGIYGIARYAIITPTVDAGLNATLTFAYDESELNGLAEEELSLYSSDDGGFTWQVRGGVVDVFDNTVTLAGIDRLSKWTCGPSAPELTITCPDDLTVSCLADVPAVNLNDVQVGGGCANPTVSWLSDVQDGAGCPLYVHRTYRAVDDCANEVFCTQTFTVHDQEPPQLQGCPGNMAVDCGGLPPVADVTASDNCNGSVPVTFAEVTTPGDCIYSFIVTRTWTAADACGNEASCTQVITVQDILAPEMTCPDPATVECVAAIPPADPASVTATDNCDPNPLVTFVGDEFGSQRCPAQVTRTYRAVDVCGNESFCTQVITVDDQTAPVFTTFPSDQTIFQCEQTQICLPVAAEDNCQGSVTLTVTGGPGAIVDGQWCVTPSMTIAYNVTIRATDTCGNFADGTFHVDYSLNTPPTVVSAPTGDFTINWALGTFSGTIAGDDDASGTLTYFIENGPEGMTVSPLGLISYDPVAADICEFTGDIVVGVRDECGAETLAAPFTLCVTNEAPVFTDKPAATTEIPWGSTFAFDFGYSDADWGPVVVFSIESFDGPGTPTIDASTGELTWMTDYEAEYTGTFHFCVKVTDDANTCDPCSPDNSETYCFDVTVFPFQLTIQKVEDVILGQQTTVSVTMLDDTYVNKEIGGFDFLIQYDPSAMTFLYASEGQFLIDCEWEYFTYRYGPNGNCGPSACPSGVLRVVALAETTGGNVAHTPTCFTNDGGASNELVKLRFLVSNDATLECQFAPIRFVWYDCGDNGVSSKLGDELFISSKVFDFAGFADYPTNEVPVYNDVTGMDDDFPTLTGALDTAYGVPYLESCDKYYKVDHPEFKLWRLIHFYNGGLDLICADSIDAVGDINLNLIAYEIADAVMFTNYFLEGTSAFPYHPDYGYAGSIAASDCNKDGITLSVADLVYLIRVIVGDAVPYAKLQPVEARVTYGNGTFGVSAEMGAAHVVVEGDRVPVSLAGNMEMRYHFDGVNTNILVYSFNAGETFSGDFLRVDGRIVSTEFATYDGQPVVSKLMPTSFVLQQNYPNPFNPTTAIVFELPGPTSYRLTVYNIEGRIVDVFDGQASAPGVFRIDWNASDHASGVYLYRLDAGQFSQTRKMLLLK
jgi:hypothetical protein